MPQITLCVPDGSRLKITLAQRGLSAELCSPWVPSGLKQEYRALLFDGLAARRLRPRRVLVVESEAGLYCIRRSLPYGTRCVLLARTVDCERLTWRQRQEMVEASVVLVKDERQMHWLTRAGLSPSKLRLVQDVAEISAVIHEQLDAGVELAIGRDVQKHYTDYWDRSQGWTPEVSVGDALFSRLFNGLIAPGHAVLDVGCGDCRNYQLRLREMGARLVGVEVSPLAADEARQAGFEVYKHELSQPLPFHDATFDRAVCVEVVEHLFDPFYCVQQIARVLKPGGILVITTPNFGYFASRLDALFNADLLFKSISDFRNPWRGDHIRFFNLAELTRMLDAAGLKPVKVRSAGNFQCLDFLVVFGGPGRVLSQVLSRRLPSWLAFPAIGDLWPGLFAGTLIVWARRVDGWAER